MLHFSSPMYILVLCSLLYCIAVATAKNDFQPYNISEDTWNEEYKSGQWNYLGKTAIERSKNAVIIALLNTYSQTGARILDVGCGVGTLADDLSAMQRKQYLGLDLSTEAITRGKRARPGLKLQVASSNEFSTEVKYDVIIFNEVLYYVDYHETIKRYKDSILAENGLIIISVWYNEESKSQMLAVRHSANGQLRLQDKVEVMGRDKDPFTNKKKNVAFSVEVFKN